MYRRFLLFLTGVLMTLVMTSCDEQGTVELTGITGLKVKGISEGVLKMEVDLRLRNTTRHNIVVRGLDAGIWYDGHEAGEVTVREKVRILKDQEAVYPVPVEVKLRGVGNMMQHLFRNGRPEDIRLKGILKVRSGPFCRKIPF